MIESKSNSDYDYVKGKNKMAERIAI